MIFLDVFELQKYIMFLTYANNIVIITGFQAINFYNDFVTLGRGGSDTSAVALAAILNADLCEIYTDVDGVYFGKGSRLAIWCGENLYVHTDGEVEEKESVRPASDAGLFCMKMTKKEKQGEFTGRV